MDGEFPEQFKCPICFEIPENEIYQCKNGHTMCDNCVKDISLCPQCRVNLKPKNIRNRALEDLLDMLKFNCSYKLEGCNKKLTRKEITTHYNSCEFGGERVLLCKFLGYSCHYKTKSRNVQESLQHLNQEHSILSMDGNMIEIQLPQMKIIHPNKSCLWRPILINAHSNHYLLVVYLNLGNVSFTCIRIGGDCKVKVGAKIKIAHDIEWITEPISQTECESALKSPPVLASLKYLLSTFVEADVLKIQVYLSDNNFTKMRSNNLTVTELDPYVIPPTITLDQYPLVEELDTLENVAVATRLQSKEPIGDNHVCNACRIGPIVGLRYQCLQCREYYLCTVCMGEKEHSFHHFAVLCTRDQVSAMNSIVARTNPRTPYFECDNKKNLSLGYAYGSISSDAKELRCYTDLILEYSSDHFTW